jgi:ferrous iron transport protein A
MAEKKQVSLNKMKNGQRGIIVDILGGSGLIKRLNALGIRLGQKVTKISSIYMRGPVTIQVNNTQVAIGFGMAKKIIVELDSH